MSRPPLTFRHLLAAILLLGTLIMPALAVAQAAGPHEQELTRLYGIALTKQVPDPLIDKKIGLERAYVRAAIDDELNALVNSLTRTESGETLDVTRSYERQRSIVETLETKLKEGEVDLELLLDEEKRLYGSDEVPSASGAVIEDYRFTGSHEELLAKKSALEERISAVKFFLQLQQERLRKLGTERALEQFSALITFAEYLGLFLVIVVVERTVRTRLFGRIANRNTRYRAMKIFTWSVYLIVIGWIMSRFYAEYPGILTSFAIVGAGIAVALQDVLKDVVGWVLIVQKRMFTLGQRITVGHITGDVMDISLLRTTLME